MTTLTIEIPKKAGKTIADLVEQLGGKVISIDSGTNIKSTRKQKILKDMEEAVEFVKLHEQGKLKAKSIEELLNEL